MNCKRCMHTGEKLPGRVANTSTHNVDGSVFAFCADHSAWADRLIAAAHKIGNGKPESLYRTLRALYGKDGSVTTRHTGKHAAAARGLFN